MREMKKVILPIIAVLSFQFPAFAQQPFKYKTDCYLESNGSYREDVCTVIETREKGGALKTRNIFSNRFGLTVKMRWVGDKFLTWDSYNQFEYHWIYKPNPDIQKDGITATYVMPGVSVHNISWD